MMLSCKEVSSLVSQGQDRRLGFADRVALRVHFSICRGCRNVNAQMALLRTAMKQLSEIG